MLTYASTVASLRVLLSAEVPRLPPPTGTVQRHRARLSLLSIRWRKEQCLPSLKRSALFWLVRYGDARILPAESFHRNDTVLHDTASSQGSTGIVVQLCDWDITVFHRWNSPTVPARSGLATLRVEPMWIPSVLLHTGSIRSLHGCTNLQCIGVGFFYSNIRGHRWKDQSSHPNYFGCFLYHDWSNSLCAQQ